MTEERCRSCKMLGGVTIENEAQARSFTAAMRANPASWTPRDLNPAPLEIGEELELPPCVGPEYERRFGRECPRAVLWPQNEIAARLVFAALPEHTRGLFPAFTQALLADLPADEARAVVLRSFRALQSGAVTDWLRAQVAPRDEE